MSATIDDLKAIERLVEALPEDQLKKLLETPEVQSGLKKWQPNPGPQTDAYHSKADCLLYGGEPGGGKSQLLLGLAYNEHKISFIMRRKYSDLDRLIEDAIKIHGSRDGLNRSPPPRIQINENQVIHFRAAQHVGDEEGTQGQGRDFLGIDEATQFAESQVRYLMGWVRSDDKNQRCRTILASNPPLQAEGLWVVTMFAPWLDEKFPNPAKPGELRWVISNEEGRDEWVEGPDDTRQIDGRTIRPTSRTYIPASVKDNPNLVEAGYERTLDALPHELRALLMGGFKTSFRDAENQLIPTKWIKAAQERWHKDGWKDFDMTAMGLDPAGGGPDSAVLCWRHAGWYAPLVALKGEQTADGSMMAAQVIRHRRANAPVIVDMGGGFGMDVTSRLKENGVAYHAFNGANKSTAIASDGMRFINERAHAWWKMREALNPDQEGGSVVALPDDPEILADLSTPLFEITPGGVKLEGKEQIKKRLGRSPDKGDAIVMCLAPGNSAVKRAINARSGPPRVHLGYAKAKRRR